MRGALVLVVAVGLALARPAHAGQQGTLDVQVSIEGAEVSIDGKVVGESPVRKRLLSVGDHTVKVTKPGYAQFLDVVRVQPSKETVVDVELFAVGAALTVTSAPPGGTVYVDDDEVGTTPWSGEAVPGSRTIRVELDGYAAAETTRDLVAGEAKTVEVTLVANAVVTGKPIYKRWYVWAGAGAAVTATVLTIVLLSSGSDPFAGADRVIDARW